uniref:CCHC NOA-type domain-containing protein n=1 Tax=Anopheles dirus TaxID=7168 RepID=A0A182NIP6_9DIPT
MSLAESTQRSMEEESFIILGTTPTPSMDNFSLPSPPVASSQPASVVEREIADSAKSIRMETSTQLDSTTYSLLTTGENALTTSTTSTVAPPQSMKSSYDSPSSPKASIITSTESLRSLPKGSPRSLMLQSIENKENVPRGESGGTTQSASAASFILGETQSILQQFPSLAHSSVPFEEIQMLQKLSMEHSQLKESLQRANVAMRKNFASIQQLQDETKARSAEQEARVDEQRLKIEQLTAETARLVAELEATRAAAKKKETEFEATRAAAMKKETELEATNKELQTELAEIGHVREVERKAAETEMDELRKESSERLALVQNLSKHAENLELQIKGFVVVQNNKPESGDGMANYVPADVHRREIKQLERRMSEEVAKNLEFEDMRKMYIDEINCLKANVKAAEQVYTASRTEIQQRFDDIKARDDTIVDLRKQLTGLQEQVQVLTAQSDIFQKDFEAERTARQELASEKSRILSEFEVLQRRNTVLTTQVSRTESEREEIAKRAAIMVQEATSSQEGAADTTTSASSTPTDEPEDEQKEPLSLLRCPLCLKGYKDFGSLQSHAADCMGIE